MQKILIIIGVIFIIVGLLFPLLSRLGLGQLPGDITFKREHVTFYFPIVTCILVSIVLSIIFWFLNK